MMGKELSTIVIILILLSVLGGSTQVIGGSDSLSYVNSNLESEEIENISIRSNDALREFADEKDLSGNGSEENPYLLANYTIDGMGDDYGVYLEDTELHFVIKNCKIYNSSESGIKINGVSNFTLENSIVKSYSDTPDGINIISSENIVIKSSSIYENDKGISLRDGANNNTITNNNISNNADRGVHIEGSQDNLIYHNIFFKNENQARDDGDNQWDQGEKGGNYWSDYEDLYPKANESIYTGIWDTPYEIFSENDNEDEYPLISPIGPPTNVEARPVRDEYVEVSWDEPLYSIRYPVEEIIIYRGEEEDNLSVYEDISSSAGEFRDENVTEGNTYYYGLTASNEKYVSVMSEVQSAQPDTTRPEVEDHYPMYDDEEVPINATIEVEFSEEMDENSIQISVEDDEGEKIEGNLSGKDTKFYFDPHENLSYETTYHVAVTGSDIAANELESPYTWSFTTVSDTGMVRGRVINEEGEPLENVRIYVDEENHTFTNASGGFQLEVPSGDITLEISKDGYQDREIEIQVNQSEEKEIEDIILNEQEGIISRWFWPLALAGGGILLLGMIALFMFFYHWEEEEPALDEDIYDIDYEDVDQEEFESWWEDEDS